MKRDARTWRFALALWAVVACDSGADGPAAGPTETGGTETTTTTGPGGSTTSSSTSGSSTGSGFIPDPDVPPCPQCECSLAQQDCPAGEKCAPYDTGDRTFSEAVTRCVPVGPDPKSRRELCADADGEYGGEDECAQGLTCWWVDPRTGTGGTCLGYCLLETDLTCGEAPEACAIFSDGALAPCLPLCNPVAQDCPNDLGCDAFTLHKQERDFACAPAPEPGSGLVHGASCSGGCEPGFYCAAATHVPGCETASCCTSFCDVQAADPDASCAPGQACRPWYADGTAPAGLENVGFCGVP